jgi:predicted deacylase
MKDALRIGPIEAAPGEIARGLLRIGELADGCSPIQIPVVLANGSADGPVVYLHGGSHGQETVYTIELMRRLVRFEVDPRALRGALVMVPAANLLAHQAASRIAPHYGVREGGPFGGDMHKLWPGDPIGSITQRLASAIWEQIVARADCVVDFHTNSSPGLAFALMYQPSGPAKSEPETTAWRRSLELADAFGLTVVLGAPTPNTLAGASILAGKPAMTVEIPTPRMLSESLVAVALRGTKNVLASLGLLDAPIEPQVDSPPIPGKHVILPSVRANRGGMVHFTVAPGHYLSAGTVIARIFDVFGDELEEIRMPQAGYVSTFPPLSWAASQAIATGDYVADCFS